MRRRKWGMAYFNAHALQMSEKIYGKKFECRLLVSRLDLAISVSEI